VIAIIVVSLLDHEPSKEIMQEFEHMYARQKTLTPHTILRFPKKSGFDWKNV
jgi:hypothetical protein